MPFLLCGRFRLDLSQPRVMAIINLTDDSFSGDGSRGDLAAAIDRAERALEQGADMLDIGAESTRPGSDPVPEQQELERVARFVEHVRDWRVPLSIDTVKPAVMRAALAAGADMINDINAFRAEGAIEAVAGSAAALCVMHMQGEPRTMQAAPHYADVVAEVEDFLAERVHALEHAGVERGRIVLDPGFGFGKSVEHNYTLLRELARFGCGGLAVLAGMSRKSMLGAVTGRAVDARMPASVAAALIAVQRGAHIVRVHDVGPTRDALKVWQALSSVS
ncbi:dihydropteroate synthase [Thauera chlorobenzoica]|uniref:dihydropteroate synthase n=1 Tax=Thauera chlorobenzoica TaxID=96773 RepID=A0A1H5VK31_9RHOO|nr:dihydropteroate synthase [Thauera chlorobenzoica]APR05762.1 Dihydropteroate synthase [Thauera chlorobenzoica]SEF87376.1 Dihydropteroate synthase [Thauera chlorobenzoica]